MIIFHLYIIIKYLINFIKIQILISYSVEFYSYNLDFFNESLDFSTCKSRQKSRLSLEFLIM